MIQKSHNSLNLQEQRGSSTRVGTGLLAFSHDFLLEKGLNVIASAASLKLGKKPLKKKIVLCISPEDIVNGQTTRESSEGNLFLVLIGFEYSLTRLKVHHVVLAE